MKARDNLEAGGGIVSLFDRIAQKYNWTLRSAPLPLSGGFLHKMYKVDTEQGIYALKILNPFIMQRDTAKENYAEAEKIELLLEKNGIPILPALTFDGRKMQVIDGMYFYVFDYFCGKALKADEICEYHCKEIGSVLAKIHHIDKKEERADFAPMSIDWRFYSGELQKSDDRLYQLLRDALPILESSQEKGNRARGKLPPIMSVCHNDMDPKNVLWYGNDFRLIDLECLSYSHPMLELFELALCWSGYESGCIDFQLFRAFLEGYRDAGGEMPRDCEILYDCNNGRLEWLEYNLKRVLGIDCGADEKEIGIRQVEETLRLVAYYADMKDEILRHCNV